MKNSIGLVLVWLNLLAAGCREGVSGNLSTNSNTNSSDTVKLVAKPPSNYQDTLIVKGAAAVFFHPDSLQLLSIRDQMDSVIYKSVTHELHYQMRNARIVLHQFYPSVPIIESKKHRFIQFQSDRIPSVLFDINTIKDISGIILFNGSSQPHITDMMNIDTELGECFQSKKI
ncbi:MAG: hypothetical protein FGM61_02565 [Sediminibacterium sp.]|nr:hypothetical protein [Sediminibacterium sp.]